MTGLQLPHDIIEPAPISWWPLAPGWWLLLVVSTLIVIAISVWLWRRWRKLAALRQALQELRAIEAQWRQQQDARASSAALSALLKRMARHCYPSEDCARLTGLAWQAFLLRTANAAFDADSVAALQQCFQAAPTSPPPFGPAAAWLRAQRRPLLQQKKPTWSVRRV